MGTTTKVLRSSFDHETATPVRQSVEECQAVGPGKRLPVHPEHELMTSSAKGQRANTPSLA